MKLRDVPTDADVPGVYFVDDAGTPRLVHEYQGGEYGLADIIPNFQLGELVEPSREGETVLVLTPQDLGTLKWSADAYSFDYDEGFIEMCLEITRFAIGRKGKGLRFTANF